MSLGRDARGQASMPAKMRTDRLVMYPLRRGVSPSFRVGGGQFSDDFSLTGVLTGGVHMPCELHVRGG